MKEQYRKSIATRLCCANFGFCKHKIIPRPKDDCISYKNVGRDGYSNITFKGYTMPRHRLAYIAAFGRIKVGYEIDHLCKNRSCINPNHLEQVTPQENVSRSPNPWAMRTSCLRGHKYTEKTMHRYQRDGKYWRRNCRICRRDQQIARRAKK